MATGVPEEGEDDCRMPSVLRQNPGKSASPFKLSEHPYLKGKGEATCPECRRQGLASGGSGDELCLMHQQARLRVVRESREKTKEWARVNIPHKEPLKVRSNLPYLGTMSVSRGGVKSALSKPHDEPLERDRVIRGFPSLPDECCYAGWAYDEVLTDGRQKHGQVKAWLYYDTPAGVMNVKVMVNGQRIFYCFEESHNPNMKKGAPDI
ncbi:hypothetical protein IX306_000728 [Porphyromonas levii]|uniref:hypothetical protein n=1 Tax=Porphyromonas levii TaxID=28114 RepID=UPI001BA961D3|nr:hypothetical protein [Porphyromonas levii]MBR8773615.1 hypothetical protein [Porphyromonas levii]